VPALEHALEQQVGVQLAAVPGAYIQWHKAVHGGWQIKKSMSPAASCWDTQAYILIQDFQSQNLQLQPGNLQADEANVGWAST
jgi:hypothetical protein